MSQISHGVQTVELREDDLTTGEYHRLLAAEQRRLVLAIIAEETAPVTLDDLAATVATRRDSPAATDDAVERIALTLHHVHLPKMADFGVLEYDLETNVVDPAGVLEFE